MDEKERRPLPCSVCGKNMVNPATKVGFIGVHLRWEVIDPEEDLAFYKRQLGVYAPLLGENVGFEIDVCWECWMKSLGVPVPGEQLDRRTHG